MSRLLAIAKRYINPSANKAKVMFTDADVKDIIDTILRADRMSADFTARFATFLRGSSDRQTLRNIWGFVRKYIRYEKDKAGHEVIKSPGKTWEDRSGDCKSMSVMIGSLVKNLNYKYYYKVVFYDKRYPDQGHIYPVVVLSNGTEVVVDAVHHAFDEELTYWKAYKYDPNTGKKEQAAAISGQATGNWSSLLGALALGATLYYFQNNSTANDEG